MNDVDSSSFSDSRVQLHWAAQLLSSTADALLQHADDDSHSNLDWDSTLARLVGRTGCSIGVKEFKLYSGDQSLLLSGETLEDAKHWLSEQLGIRLTLREYDMPQHEVSNGSVLSPRPEHLEEMASWLTFAQELLADHGLLRVWPHHFDLGFWNPMGKQGRSIGGGFSLGDANYPQPYFYINPYGLDRPESLPALPAGQWAESWFGAVILAEEIEGELDLAKKFLDSALGVAFDLVNSQ